MQAYEFYAVPKNGAIIIPDIYKKKIVSGVKVIILEEKPLGVDIAETQVKCKSDYLLPPTLDTQGWKFNREEANER